MQLRYNVHFGNWGPKFMMAKYHPGVHKYALFVVAWALVLLTAGALVTSEDAALAVPDWPLSYGTLNPPMVGGIAFEHSHRLIAAALGLFIIGLAFLLWRYDERPWMKYLGFAALFGVGRRAACGFRPLAGRTRRVRSCPAPSFVAARIRRLSPALPRNST